MLVVGVLSSFVMQQANADNNNDDHKKFAVFLIREIENVHIKMEHLSYCHFLDIIMSNTYNDGSCKQERGRGSRQRFGGQRVILQIIHIFRKCV